MVAYVRYFKWVMFASGLLTCTVFYTAIAPTESLQSTFGASLDGALAQVLVRNWGVLVGLMGLMLIWGSFNEVVRRQSLVIAGTSKVAFIILVLTYGRQFLEHQVRTSIVVDSIMVLLFAIYLFLTRGKVAA